MIPGWDQGLLGVCKGEERHLVVPSSLAYGDRGAGDVIPPDATLLFDIVVVDVIKAKSAEDLRREKEEEERRRAAAAAKEAEAKSEVVGAQVETRETGTKEYTAHVKPKATGGKFMFSSTSQISRNV